MRLALEHAPGEHSLEVILIEGLTQGRLLDMIRQGYINVTLGGYNSALEREFLQVDFPLTLGLQGYRILVIHPSLQDKISKVQTLDDLKPYCIGSGANWQDTRILKEAGLCVEEAPQKALFDMLEKGRFEMLHRAVHEALVGENLPDLTERGLVLEQDLLIRYPYDFFYYLAKQNTELHHILEQGFETAFRNGAFIQYFQSNRAMRNAVEHIRHANRRIIDIENADMSTRTADRSSRYWLTN
ncbi:MAG: hypothetical protein KTR23_02920 [Rhodospirillales bacterium]|nr:hypothetical protein [Rhodospirillales bacterium]